MHEIWERGVRPVIDDAIARASDGCDAVYLSVDIDVLDPGFAPGTGTPEPGGMTPADLLRAVRTIALETLWSPWTWSRSRRPTTRPTPRWTTPTGWCSRPSRGWLTRSGTCARARSRSRLRPRPGPAAPPTRPDCAIQRYLIRFSGPLSLGAAADTQQCDRVTMAATDSGQAASVAPKQTVSPLTVRVTRASRARPTRSSRSRVGNDPPASTRAMED
jgi:hypothetical protein